MQAAVLDPIKNVNRFLSLGQLDAYYEVVRNKVKNGELVCDDGFELVGNRCLLFRPAQLYKRDHKIECLKLGATLFAPMDEYEQEELLGFLDLQVEGTETRVWIGFNDAKTEGLYVVDNSKVKDSLTQDIFHGEKIYLQAGQMIYKPMNMETVV